MECLWSDSLKSAHHFGSYPILLVMEVLPTLFHPNYLSMMISHNLHEIWSCVFYLKIDFLKLFGGVSSIIKQTPAWYCHLLSQYLRLTLNKFEWNPFCRPCILNVNNTATTQCVIILILKDYYWFQHFAYQLSIVLPRQIRKAHWGYGARVLLEINLLLQFEQSNVIVCALLIIPRKMSQKKV